MKIGVIGLGFVGLSQCAGFLEKGHIVIGYDIVDWKVQLLKCGMKVIDDEDVNKVLFKHLNENLFFTNDINDLKGCDVYVICVPTKYSKLSKDFYYGNVIDAIKDVLSIGGKLIILKSTMGIGSVRKIYERVVKGSGAELFYIPEFSVEGKALQDVLCPDRVVIGSVCKGQVPSMIKDLYNDYENVLFVSFEEAEIIKLCSNAYLGMRVVFANEVYRICDKFECSVDDVLRGIGLDKRIGLDYMNPGIGYGGGCFPKDIKCLCGLIERENIQSELFRAVDKSNELQIDYFVRKIKGLLSASSKLNICVLGVTFKKGVNDIRGSNVLDLVDRIMNDLDFDVGGMYIFDFNEDVLKSISLIVLEYDNVEVVDRFEDIKEKVRSSDIVIVGVDDERFKDLKFKEGSVIVDCRNLFKNNLVFKYAKG